MTKLIVLLLALGWALFALRAALFRRQVSRERRERDHPRPPSVGVLFVIGVTAVVLFALFVLPGLMDRLP